jgi:cytochrome c-type biogenesis protein CcmH/NrfG
MTTRIRRWFPYSLAGATLTGAYLYAFPNASLIFVAGVLAHVGAGLLLTLALVHGFATGFGARRPMARIGWVFLASGAAMGLVLLVTGALRPYQNYVLLHIGLSLAGAVLVAADLLGQGMARRWPALLRLAALAVLAAGVSAGADRVRASWHDGFRILNPRLPPATMEGEGDGPGGPFFPSSSQTSTQGFVPVDFFMESEKCERCHSDIYDQWFSSAHHFSSFNNQWYRKSIEYMQDVIGTEPSKWCGGCHDPAVLFTGLMDTPIREIIDRPESQVGLGCVMCHSISVKSTMGQGDYTINYPDLYQLATSDNPAARLLHDFVTNLNPEAHRRSFLKPPLEVQAGEFCSSCHKVHLDEPVNDYRWIRGFNDYDNWQASGVSGMGARSFYYPPRPQTCADCHMPLVASEDLGNEDGMVHSHRFPAANTALPLVNDDPVQMQAVIDFLTDDIVSVDIFAVSSAEPVTTLLDSLPGTELSTTFAVGEEAAFSAGGGLTRTATPVTAPIDRTDAVVRRGDSVRVDVVVRTRKVGHFFPGGTVDAFDVWVELVGRDETGRILFRSGEVADEGQGPVDKDAHFYRAVLIDAHGNPIDKRNAWAARALAYARLIPPGAADTVHYRIDIPEDAGQELRLEARLHYRKFAWFNTGFAFAGVRSGGEETLAPGYDDGVWTFDGDTSGVSGQIKEIPILPIITLAADAATLRVVGANADRPEPETSALPEDWMRWNDYGIGLLLQGDLKGAEAAFIEATRADPENVDGWVNIGRVRVQEGNLEGAREVLERALGMSPDLARTHFFYARMLREAGDYDRSIEHLTRVLEQYPKDRVVLNEAGRVRFLQRQYAEALGYLERVLEIDPEDLMAHYNLMLSWNGLGEVDRAIEHQQLYLRFKADESAQAITGPFRQEYPEHNRERQPIHEHGAGAAAPGEATRAASVMP